MRLRAAALALLAIAVGPVALVGCGSDPKADLAATEVALTEAEAIALRYVTQPTCNGYNAPLCSDPATVAAIKEADNRAYAAVKLARRINTPTQAEAVAAALAVAELTAITQRLPRKEN
jgi:hypothetical protein